MKSWLKLDKKSRNPYWRTSLLFINPFDEKLLHHVSLAKEARISRMKKIVANLRNIGFKINAADCLKASLGESVGRPHIVAALNSHPENETVMESLVSRLHKNSLTSPEHQMLYETLDMFPNNFSSDFVLF